jgi:hypothetical protein
MEERIKTTAYFGRNFFGNFATTVYNGSTMLATVLEPTWERT